MLARIAVGGDSDDKGLTGIPGEEVGPEPGVFHRYWLAVPHSGILKADAWPMWLEFLECWAVYPRREGKLLAWKAWLKARPVLADIITALEWQKECEQWRKDDGAYVPYLATYLNQFRWEDECPAGSSNSMAQIVPLDAKRYTADGLVIEEEE